MTQRQRLTVSDAAKLAKISDSTWRAYVARGQAPAADGHFGRTPYWKASTVAAWLAKRASMLACALVALFVLSGCGGSSDDATAPHVSTPAASNAVTTSEPIDITTPGAEQAIIARVDAGLCFSISFGSTAVEWSSHMAAKPTSGDDSVWRPQFSAWVRTLPEGCTPDDTVAINAWLG